MSKGKNIALWVASVMLGLAFFGAGGSKLGGVEMHVENFARWGYPGWFMYVVGAIGLVCAVLVLIPKTRSLGAAGLVSAMIGAAGTHVIAGEIPMIVPNLVLGGLAGFVAFTLRPAILGGSAAAATS